MRHAEGRRGMGGEAAAVRPWAQIMGYSHIRILGCAVRIVGWRKSSGSPARARALQRWLPAPELCGLPVGVARGRSLFGAVLAPARPCHRSGDFGLGQTLRCPRSWLGSV